MSLAAQSQESEPENEIPGSTPLGNPDRWDGFAGGYAPTTGPGASAARERYARARALGFGIVESGRRAGWSPTSGAASKAEREPRIIKRIKYLSGIEDQKIKRQRADMERLLALRAAGNMDNFVRYEWMGETGNQRLIPFLDLSKLADLTDDERRELMAQVESIEHGQYGPKLKLVSPLDAIAQLRQLNGLDEPKVTRNELTGKDGGPIKTQHASDLSDEELAAIATGKV